MNQLEFASLAALTFLAALLFALLLGLAVAGSAQIIRALAPIDRLAVPPLSCDLCMSAWPCAVALVVALCGSACVEDWSLRLLISASAIVASGAAVAVSVFVLRATAAVRDARP